MQDVAKKKRKRIWLCPFLLIAAAIAALLLLGVFSKQQSSKPLPSSNEKIRLWQAAEGGITKIKVRPSRGEAYTLLKNDGLYTVEGQPEYPVNQTMAEELFSGFSGIVATEQIKGQAGPDELSAFGISASSPSVSLTDAQGNESQWTFGSVLPGDVLSWYLYSHGHRGVFLTTVHYQELCDYSLPEMHTVPEINFNAELVNAVSVAGGTGWGLERSQGLWYLNAPFRYPASLSSVETLLKSIGTSRLALYEAEATEQTLKQYGLLPARMEITLSLSDSVIHSTEIGTGIEKQIEVPAHQKKLSIGASAGITGFYCLYEGAVYKATYASLGYWLRFQASDFLLHTPINFQPAILRGVTVQANGKTQAYTIDFAEQVLPNNRIAADKEGNTLYDMHVARDGMPVESAAFTRAYMELTSLALSGDASWFSVHNKTPLVSIGIRHDAGSRKVAFYDADPLFFAVEVDGVVRQYVEKKAVLNLTLLSNPL